MLTALTASFLMASSASQFIIGQCRISFLSPTIVRIEQRGPHGFEDRLTFHVVKRPGKHVQVSHTVEKGIEHLVTDRFAIVGPASAVSPRDFKFTKPNGDPLFALPPELSNSVDLPNPADVPDAWCFADNPRIVPPKWGANPAPKPAPNSGWDLSNDAPDVYVFVPGGDFAQLRRDFLDVTGPADLPPLYAFGYVHSRYEPYSSEQIIELTKKYQKRGFPISLFVIDTDWRIGASHGYGANTKLHPNLPSLLSDLHDLGVRSMFNDHPEPQAETALDDKEMRYRAQGLQSWLRAGLDSWWFDRNWMTHLHSPAEGLRLEAWGMKVYHDMTLAVHPNRRPLILANVDGIDNGIRKAPANVASHRYSMQWTGDTQPEFADLRRAVENAVNGGVWSANPYINDDLGGHSAAAPRELYTRFMQYGALSPMMRLHCTAGIDYREPWVYGPEVEQIVRDYTQLRIALLPTINGLAHENFESGQPLLRRCDLEWPSYKEAKAGDQFTLGPNLMVAPIVDAGESRACWIPPGNWRNVWTNEVVSGPAVIKVSATLAQMPIFVRQGGVIGLIPVTVHAVDRPWSEVLLHVEPQPGEKSSWELVEDDRQSLDYQKNKVRRTHVALKVGKSGDGEITIEPAVGKYSDDLKHRHWYVRLSSGELMTEKPKVDFPFELAKDGAPFPLLREPNMATYDLGEIDLNTKTTIRLRMP